MFGFGCIYLYTNLITGGRYVGQHFKTDPSERNYNHVWSANKGSKACPKFYNAIRKYGIENFTLETLVVCPWDALDNLECYYAEVLETYHWDMKGGYNVAVCGSAPMRGLKHSQESREKMSKACKNRSQETREKLSKASTGRVFSQESREKMSKAKQNLSKETRDKLSAATKGKVKSQEHKDKLSKASTGRVFSQETREKMSKSGKARFHSQETCEKLSAAGKARWERYRLAKLQAS